MPSKTKNIHIQFLGCADNRTAYKTALENGFDCNGISFNMAAETMTNSNAVFLATKMRLLFLYTILDNQISGCILT